MVSSLNKIPAEIHQYLLEKKEDELPYRCLICGNRPFFIGHIEKSNPTRMLIYCLCWDCYEKPDSDSAVEKIISYYEITRQHSPNLLEHFGKC
jgi:hypothetical protein